MTKIDMDKLRELVWVFEDLEASECWALPTQSSTYDDLDAERRRPPCITTLGAKFGNSQTVTMHDGPGKLEQTGRPTYKAYEWNQASPRGGGIGIE